MFFVFGLLSLFSSALQATILSADEGGDDDEVSRTQMGRRVLYRVVGGGGNGDATLERVDVDTTILSRNLLEPSHTYVLDIHEEVFVWAGMESSGEHKFVAMQRAEELIKERAPHCDISWVLDGFVTMSFDRYCCSTLSLLRTATNWCFSKSNLSAGKTANRCALQSSCNCSDMSRTRSS